MMSEKIFIKNGKIYVSARRKQQASGQQTIRISEEAYNALVDVYNETTTSMKDLASVLILDGLKRVTLNKED